MISQTTCNFFNANQSHPFKNLDTTCLDVRIEWVHYQKRFVSLSGCDSCRQRSRKALLTYELGPRISDYNGVRSVNQITWRI